MSAGSDEQRDEFDTEEWERVRAELYAVANEADVAGDPRAIAAAYVELAEHLADVAGTDEVIDAVLGARDAYAEFDPEAATELLQVIGLIAFRSGDYVTAHEAMGLACDELSEYEDHEKFAGALNDFGTLSTQVGEFDDADRALGLAEQIYLELGTVDDVAEVRLNLANNHRMSGRRQEAEKAFLELVDFFGDATLRAAMCLTSLAATYVESGRPQLAVPAFERAIEICEREGDREHATESRMGLALVFMATGDVARGEELLSEAIRFFEATGKPDKVAICEYNRANAALARHDFSVADEAFAAARDGLAAAGMHHQLANLAWNRVKRLVTEASIDPLRRATLSAEAVDTAVAALIAGDYQRFQFADARRRARWRESLEHRITWTFIMVRQLGSVTLMADLIETVLSGGVHGLVATEADADPLNLDIPLDMTDVRQTVSTDPFGESGDIAFAMAQGLGATLLDRAELPMAPPPALVDGDGRLLLARQREMAASLDPYLAAVLQGAPRVPIW